MKAEDSVKRFAVLYFETRRCFDQDEFRPACSVCARPKFPSPLRSLLIFLLLVSLCGPLVTFIHEGSLRHNTLERVGFCNLYVALTVVKQEFSDFLDLF